MAMKIDEGGHNRFPANVPHVGVLGNGNGPRLAGGDEMIAFDDEHGVLDSRRACSINQTRAFEDDPLRFSLSANAGASSNYRQKNTQNHQRVRTIEHFHFVPPDSAG